MASASCVAAASAFSLCAGLTLLGAGASQAASFNPAVAATIVEEFTSSNLATNSFFQAAFATNAPGGLAISSAEYSYDSGANYTPFAAFPASISVTPYYANIVSKGSPISVPFLIRYVIEPGAANGDIVQLSLLTNINGEASGAPAVLANNFNNLADIARPVTAETSAVPGPLPLVGAGAAFAFSRRLRRRTLSQR